MQPRSVQLKFSKANFSIFDGEMMKWQTAISCTTCILNKQRRGNGFFDIKIVKMQFCRYSAQFECVLPGDMSVFICGGSWVMTLKCGQMCSVSIVREHESLFYRCLIFMQTKCPKHLFWCSKKHSPCPHRPHVASMLKTFCGAVVKLAFRVSLNAATLPVLF